MKSSTTWKKGQSGNPRGRPKEVGPVRELAKRYTEAAIETLAEVMQDKAAPHSARIAAAEALLGRGWGKPQQAIEMAVEHSSPMPMPDLAAIWLRAGAQVNQSEERESSGPDNNTVTH
jgi:hypothetical protein